MPGVFSKLIEKTVKIIPGYRGMHRMSTKSAPSINKGSIRFQSKIPGSFLQIRYLNGKFICTGKSIFLDKSQIFTSEQLEIIRLNEGYTFIFEIKMPNCHEFSKYQEIIDKENGEIPYLTFLGMIDQTNNNVEPLMYMKIAIELKLPIPLTIYTNNNEDVKHLIDFGRNPTTIEELREKLSPDVIILVGVISTEGAVMTYYNTFSEFPSSESVAEFNIRDIIEAGPITINRVGIKLKSLTPEQILELKIFAELVLLFNFECHYNNGVYFLTNDNDQKEHEWFLAYWYFFMKYRIYISRGLIIDPNIHCPIEMYREQNSITYKVKSIKYIATTNLIEALENPWALVFALSKLSMSSEQLLGFVSDLSNSDGSILDVWELLRKYNIQDYFLPMATPVYRRTVPIVICNPTGKDISELIKYLESVGIIYVYKYPTTGQFSIATKFTLSKNALYIFVGEKDPKLPLSKYDGFIDLQDISIEKVVELALERWKPSTKEVVYLCDIDKISSIQYPKDGKTKVSPTHVKIQNSGSPKYIKLVELLVELFKGNITIEEDGITVPYPLLAFIICKHRDIFIESSKNVSFCGLFRPNFIDAELDRSQKSGKYIFSTIIDHPDFGLLFIAIKEENPKIISWLSVQSNPKLNTAISQFVSELSIEFEQDPAKRIVSVEFN